MKKILTITAAASAAALFGVSAPAHAGTDAYIGEIIWSGTNFCPRNTAPADGSLLPISSNQALFSLLGTTYGGDGRSTFQLPDLRGRVSLHTGSGPGLSPRPLGSRGGEETTTLSAAQMPAHSHGASTGIVARANSGSGQTASPAGNVLANGRTARIYSTNPANVDMDATSISASTTVGATGGSQPANNIQPFLTLQACIVTQGIFPSRP